MIDLALFHFIRPEWLLALIPLLVLLVSVMYLHKQQSGWQSVLASHLYKHIITSKSGKNSRPPMYLLGLGWLIAVVALAGPTWEQLPQPVYQLHTGKVVVIDMSLSMRATDVKPDRLTIAKFKGIDLIKAISEGETGLVAYAGDAFTISPLSSDSQNLTTLLPSLTPEIMPVAGSEPYLGIESAINLLKNAGFQEGDIFWITDGIERNQVDELTSLIKQSPFRLSVLAVGTEDGAPIQQLDGELVKDSRGAIVIPKVSMSSLQNLATAGGGRFAPLQPDDSDIVYLTSQNLVDRDTTQPQDEEQEQSGDEWKEMGPYLVLLMLPFAAYAFRRGMVTVLLLSVMLPTVSPKAHADWWQDLWKTGDQQGIQQFNQQQFDQAADSFDDPLWRGTALYRNGDYQAAVEAFAQSDSVEAKYNMANALAKLNELKQAIDLYDEVLSMDPNHEDAKFNKELLEQQQQQQNQDQQQQNQDQDQENQQQDQDQQGEQNQQNEQSENSTGEGSEQQKQNDSEAQQEEQQENKENEEQQQGEEQTEQQEQPSQPQPAEQQELTEEEKEQMQRMQNLLRKVPDDPAFLLKRKMQLENQDRRRNRVPTQTKRKW